MQRDIKKLAVLRRYILRVDQLDQDNQFAGLIFLLQTDCINGVFDGIPDRLGRWNEVNIRNLQFVEHFQLTGSSSQDHVNFSGIPEFFSTFFQGFVVIDRILEQVWHVIRT